MKKKMMALLLTAIMAVTMMAGCEKPAEEVTTGGQQEKTTAAADGEVKDASDYKVALLIPGNLGDKSFFDAAYAAMEPIKSELGIPVDYVEVGTDATKYYPTFVDLCEQGYDVILTISSNCDDALLEAAAEYPDQKFINLDTELSDVPDNVYIMGTRNNEMCYLAGAAAALKAEELGEKTIGFVGGMDIPGINEFLLGYIEGAQYIMPDIKVATSYVGSFTDSAKGKENGLLLYNKGISVVFAAAGQSGLGVIDAATQKGKFAIGVDSDQAEALKESNPDMANVIITSAIKMVGNNAVDVLDRAMKGNVNYGTREVFGLKEGSVGLAENEFYEKLMSQEQRDQIEEIKKGVMDGSISITETKGISTDEVVKIRDSVRP